MKQTNSHNQVMAVALTGHRSIPYDKVPSLRKALRTVILEHYNRGSRIFYCGMAMGFDLLAAETGRIVKEGDAPALLNDPAVRAAYLGTEH